MGTVSPEEAIGEIRKRTFRVHTTSSGETRVGTAFMIARLQPSNRIVIATARHLLEFPSDAQVAWCFQCLGADGGVIGECHFTCDEAESESRPYRFYKYADVGFCVLPPPEQEDEGISHRGERSRFASPTRGDATALSQTQSTAAERARGANRRRRQREAS